MLRSVASAADAELFVIILVIRVSLTILVTKKRDIPDYIPVKSERHHAAWSCITYKNQARLALSKLPSDLYESLNFHL
jgi:nitrogen fixation protein